MEYGKFKTAIELMEKCIKLSNACVRSPAGYVDSATHTAWDTVYKFIHSTFQEPATAQANGETFAQCKARLGDKTFDTEVNLCRDILNIERKTSELLDKIKAMPPVFAEVVFPVALARHMLRDASVYVDARNLDTFDEYYRRYACMILEAADITKKA
jgi:hypothetical protein